MIRQEMMEKDILDFAAQKLEKSITQITEYYKKNHRNITQGFLEKVMHGLQQCQKDQKKLGYISISVLESSLITKKYELQIAFCDKNLYADNLPIDEYWAPAFLYQNLESDIKEMEDLLRKRIIRLRPYEVYELSLKYATNFYVCNGFIIRNMAPEIARLPIFHEISKESQVKILFGKYMEKKMELVALGDQL